MIAGNETEPLAAGDVAVLYQGGVVAVLPAKVAMEFHRERGQFVLIGVPTGLGYRVVVGVLVFFVV